MRMLKWLYVVAVILSFLIPSLVAAQTNDQPAVRIIMFHSPHCPYCREVLENVLPPIQAIYGDRLEVQFYDLTVPEDYAIFAALHERFPDLPGSIPQLYIDHYYLVGSVDIRDSLPGLIDECLEKGGCNWPFKVQLETTGASNILPDANPVYLAYCYDPTCLECDRVSYDLGYLQTQYPNLVVRKFNVRDDAALIEAMCERYQVPPEDRLVAPAIFVGESYLTPGEIDLSVLRSAIESADVNGDSPAPWEALDAQSLKSAVQRLVERFQGFDLLAIMFAGLVDGVNPCAFTTMIFFVSYLALLGREKRDILLVGLTFTIAVFVTYLALGMGLSAVVERISGIGSIGRLVYGVTALMCFVLAVLSLWDYFRIRQGRMNEMTLQLPKLLKKRIHETIRTHSRMRGYVAAAFIAGVLVSAFELACTGQVYLPTIVFMVGLETTRLSAIFNLLLYNLMFVLPLAAVFIVTYLGTSSQRLTAVFQSNAGAVKLLTASLFGVFAAFILASLL